MTVKLATVLCRMESENIDLQTKIELLRTALRLAAGALSTHPPHTGEHPQAVYENLLKAAEVGENDK